MSATPNIKLIVAALGLAIAAEQGMCGNGDFKMDGGTNRDTAYYENAVARGRYSRVVFVGYNFTVWSYLPVKHSVSSASYEKTSISGDGWVAFEGGGILSVSNGVVRYRNEIIATNAADILNAVVTKEACEPHAFIRTFR